MENLTYNINTDKELLECIEICKINDTLNNVTTLTLGNIQNIENIKLFPNLTKLRFNRNNKINYDILSNFNHLKFLEFESFSIFDIKNILNLAFKIESLSFCHTEELENTHLLNSFVNLKYLDLHQTDFHDIQNISKLTKLESLIFTPNNIEGMDELIPILKNMGALPNKLVNWEYLGNLINLKYLDLRSIHKLDLNHISNLTNITTLLLGHEKRWTTASNINALHNLNNLERLDLLNVKFDNLDLSFFPKLKELSISGLDIYPEKVISCMPNLLLLYINGKEVNLKKYKK
ncbi:MAG: hypothetical protein J0H68_09295 [Sphingobacteriia bacterium]|nr:hypothetical protein [Sphingobacteriia bacterium]